MEYTLHFTGTLLRHTLPLHFLGGMQTEGISDMPRFKNGTTFMLPNIGGEKSLTPTWRPSSKKPDASEDEDIRVRSKFLSVKA